MADHHLNRVPTFPRLADTRVDRLAEQINAAVTRRPIGIVIPSLFSDLAAPAMRGIVAVLASAEFVRRVYISLDRASEDEYLKAREIIAPLGDKAVLLWNDAPAVQAVIGQIDQTLPLGPRGKGRAVWVALGYVLARSEVSVIGVHDADVLTYDREFLLRLLYFVALQRYQFTKGYYARHADRLYGRGVRLFYFPFVRALRNIVGASGFLEYMADFRYPLSGEFATFTSIAREMRFPSDWGLEVGVLGEVYRLLRVQRICQVELTGRYDHKHQEVGEQGRSGLVRMAAEIARTFLTHLAGQGRVLSPEFYNTLKLTYSMHAREFVLTYESAADLHGGLHFDLHEELTTVELFAEAIRVAADDFLAQPFGSPLIPDWKRVEVAMPGIMTRLCQTLEST
jgi:glucosyl-3-phosphoglycerate synthase